MRLNRCTGCDQSVTLRDGAGRGLTCGCAALPFKSNAPLVPGTRSESPNAMTKARRPARPPAGWHTLLGDLHRALGAWPSGVPGRTEATHLRDALADYARDALRAASRDGRVIPSRKGATTLGVSYGVTVAWCAQGGPLHEPP